MLFSFVALIFPVRDLNPLSTFCVSILALSLSFSASITASCASTIEKSSLVLAILNKSLFSGGLIKCLNWLNFSKLFLILLVKFASAWFPPLASINTSSSVRAKNSPRSDLNCFINHKIAFERSASFTSIGTKLSIFANSSEAVSPL